MRLLTNKLVEDLFNCTTKEKEEIGNLIVQKLGGDSQKIANGLPIRRGNADGGIDGRIPILQEVVTHKMRPGGIRLNYDEEIELKPVDAAFCIKIERKTFDRYQLGAFKNDMEREKIFEGIIISASELSADAQKELERINKEGRFIIEHILIADILSGNINSKFKFIHDPKEIFVESLRKYTKS